MRGVRRAAGSTGGEVVSACPHPVLLVGAGPGDPELLTLKAVRAIAQADVLLVDDLVDRRVLAHARPGARIVEVGKRGGCPSTPQAFIERLLVHCQPLQSGPTPLPGCCRVSFQQIRQRCSDGCIFRDERPIIVDHA